MPQKRSQRPKLEPGSLTLRVTLSESEPAIWRSVQISKTYSLHQLHRVIQALFSWTDYHLYEFRIGDRTFQAPGEESEGDDSTKVRLGALGLRAGDSFEYVYDFGDDWLHEIAVEDATSANEEEGLPWLLGGDRAGPPEDSGGIHRYQELLGLREAALRGEKLVPDDLDGLDSLPDGFDPDEFSLPGIRHALVLFSAWGALDS